MRIEQFFTRQDAAQIPIKKNVANSLTPRFKGILFTHAKKTHRKQMKYISLMRIDSGSSIKHVVKMCGLKILSKVRDKITCEQAKPLERVILGIRSSNS